MFPLRELVNWAIARSDTPIGADWPTYLPPAKDLAASFLAVKPAAPLPPLLPVPQQIDRPAWDHLITIDEALRAEDLLDRCEQSWAVIRDAFDEWRRTLDGARTLDTAIHKLKSEISTVEAVDLEMLSYARKHAKLEQSLIKSLVSNYEGQIKRIAEYLKAKKRPALEELNLILQKASLGADLATANSQASHLKYRSDGIDFSEAPEKPLHRDELDLRQLELERQKARLALDLQNAEDRFEIFYGRTVIIARLRRLMLAVAQESENLEQLGQQLARAMLNVYSGFFDETAVSGIKDPGWVAAMSDPQLSEVGLVLRYLREVILRIQSRSCAASYAIPVKLSRIKDKLVGKASLKPNDLPFEEVFLPRIRGITLIAGKELASSPARVSVDTVGDRNPGAGRSAKQVNQELAWSVLLPHCVSDAWTGPLEVSGVAALWNCSLFTSFTVELSGAYGTDHGEAELHIHYEHLH